MSMRKLLRGTVGLSLILAVMAFGRNAIGAEQGGWITGQGKFDPKAEAVDLFDAIEAGQVEARLIARDSRKCRVFIRNKGDKPLNVALPEAFAGVPILAQEFPGFGDGGGIFGDNFRDIGMDDQPQQVGGGMPGMEIFNPMQQQNNRPLFNLPEGMQNRAWFNIPPERVAMVKGTTVCLEHGKPDPRPTFVYAIRPVPEVTGSAAVEMLCAMLGRRLIDQRAAQIAAWHLNNDMSFEQLADLRGRALGGLMPMFSRAEIDRARQAAERATAMAEKHAESNERYAASRKP
jgi:hypothetical protein